MDVLTVVVVVAAAAAAAAVVADKLRGRAPVCKGGLGKERVQRAEMVLVEMLPASIKILPAENRPRRPGRRSPGHIRPVRTASRAQLVAY
jgi:hypothetical protein